MEPGHHRRGPGHRAGLRPEVVIAAARSLSRREGLAAVTMRRLAADLGVAPHALYGHFADKTALLDAVLDDVIGEVQPPDPRAVAWAEGLVALMGQTRRLLLDHAELIPLFLSRPRRGRNAIRLGEVTLQLLARGGIHGEPAVRALRALLVYSFGFAALEAPWRTAPREFPTVARLAAPLGRQPTDEDFHAGLNWLLAGIAERA